MMATQPVRPFGCSECGNQYTRQEHLARHQTAKHRQTKEFTCPVCDKAFARRDILKRHEVAHDKRDEKKSFKPVKHDSSGLPSASRSTPQRSPSVEGSKKRSQASKGLEDLPVKVMRIARACNRCSKSKLRCDGEMPCERCAKNGFECTFDRSTTWNDRPTPSLPISLAPSNSSSSGETSNFTGDSGEEEVIRPPAERRFDPWARSGNVVPDAWSRGSTPLPLPISPYALPARTNAALHVGALPPSSFVHSSSGSTALTPNYFNPISYSPNRPLYPPNPLLPPVSDSDSVNLNQFPLQPGLGGAPQDPQFQWDLFARPSASTAADVTMGSSSDFLDLIASTSVDTEIDWELLNAAWTPTIGGTGFTPNEGNSPTAADLEQSLLSQDPPPMALHPTLRLNSTSLDPSGSYYPPELTLRNRSDSDVRIQDSAAVSLLQLASHTPRQSPEPESRAHRLGEEKPRSSHPSYTPSDPWPLSYRPTLAQEVVLPNGRSRAPTPMRDLDSVPATVPRVLEATRERILRNVREISAGFSHFDHSHRFVPHLELLDLFVQLYFLRHHALIPLLHTPTFDPNTSPAFLVISVAAIGARYAHDVIKNAEMFAHALAETSRRMLQTVGDIDNTIARTVAWVQAVVLTLHVGLFSGNKAALERTQSFSALPVTLCRRQGWLKESALDEALEATFSLADRWRRWKDREEIKRLGFGAIYLDGMGTVMWDLESTSLFVEGARTSLPCTELLWEAPTAEAWQSLFVGSTMPPRSTDLLTAINHASDLALHTSEALVAASRDVFAMSVVLTVLHCIGWMKLREANIAALFLPPSLHPEKTMTPVQLALQSGFEYFQDHVLCSSPSEEEMGDPRTESSINSMALMLHLSAMTTQLPLRLLQAMARAGHSTPSSSVMESLRSWALQDGGHTARKTIWHAGQLLGLSRIVDQDAPLAPFSLFSSALALVAYIDHAGGQEIMPRAEGDVTPTTISLDTLTHRGEPLLATWLATGHGIPVLEEIGPLELEAEGGVDEDERGRCGERLLRFVGSRLLGMKVWKVAEQLGNTLLQLAEEGRDVRIQIKVERV